MSEVSCADQYHSDILLSIYRPKVEFLAPIKACYVTTAKFFINAGSEVATCLKMKNMKESRKDDVIGNYIINMCASMLSQLNDSSILDPLPMYKTCK